MTGCAPVGLVHGWLRRGCMVAALSSNFSRPRTPPCTDRELEQGIMCVCLCGASPSSIISIQFALSIFTARSRSPGPFIHRGGGRPVLFLASHMMRLSFFDACCCVLDSAVCACACACAVLCCAACSYACWPRSRLTRPPFVAPRPSSLAPSHRSPLHPR